MKDFIDELNKAARETDLKIINPKTLEQLKKQGLETANRPIMTLDQYVDLLYGRIEEARKIAAQLPSPPKFPHPAIMSLYGEIRDSIILGQNGAAITLSGILVEYIMKYTAYTWEMGGFAKWDPQKWDEFENMDFSAAIGRLNKTGLLKKETRKKLIEFKDRIRNPYNHYNIKKITKSVVVRNVKVASIKAQKIETQDIAVEDEPIFQAEAKRLVDFERVLDVFGFADSVVKWLLFQLHRKFD